MFVETDPDTAVLRMLEDELYAFNVKATGHDDGEYLSIFLRDAEGAVIGGVHGWSWGGTGYVRTLFVPASLRGKGQGGALMDAFEAEARRRGCTQLVLTTHDFQAPEFYRRRGFAVIGEAPEYPRGFRLLTMAKPLV